MMEQINEALGVILHTAPDVYAYLRGSNEYPGINGVVLFYPFLYGTLVLAEVQGLPPAAGSCMQIIQGFHIHEGSQCLPAADDPFGETGMHFNPKNCPHPNHAGDLPPLFSCRGTALQMVYTDRFYPDEVIGRTVVIHDMADDFRSQPSGDSGMKIACGEIMSCR